MIGMLATRPSGGGSVVTMDDRRLLDEPHQDQDELRENTARIAEEFYEGFQAVERIDRPAVSMFGSARIDEDSPEYALGAHDRRSSSAKRAGR